VTCQNGETRIEGTGSNAFARRYWTTL